METPTLLDPVRVAPEVHLLPAYFPIPGLGILPMNVFLLSGEEPVLIDTGPGPLAADFTDAVTGLIDPRDLRWIWLTHADPDHIGAIQKLLALAPRAQVATGFLGAAKLALQGIVPQDRIHVIQDGDRVTAGGRDLIALRPPVFDAPETLAAFDTRSRVLFSADSFGTLLAEPAASAAEIPDGALREGMATWAGIDLPWLELVDPRRLEAKLEKVRRLEPSMVLSAHLPPAQGSMIGRLGEHLQAARGAVATAGAEEISAWLGTAVSGADV